MVHSHLPTRTRAHKTYRRRENASSALPGLHGSCNETSPVAHSFYVVQDRDLAVARQHEVAVHAVDCVVLGRDSELGCGEALGYRDAAEDTAGAGRVPERAGIGKDVGAYVCEGQELEGVFDGRVVGEGGGRLDEGWFGHDYGTKCCFARAEVRWE